jgi:hypothetical protein
MDYFLPLKIVPVLYHDSYKTRHFMCFVLRSATLEAPVFCGVSTDQTSQSTHGPNDKMLVEETQCRHDYSRLMIIIDILFTNKYFCNNNE